MGAGELVITSLVVVVSTLMLVQSFSLPFNAALLPRLVSCAVLVLSVYRGVGVIMAWVSHRRRGIKKVASHGLSWLVWSALLLGYWAASYLVGFPISTFVYMLVLPKLMGYRKMWEVLVLAAGITLVLNVVLGWGLRIHLPMGTLWS